jgi:hypothetical protein
MGAYYSRRVLTDVPTCVCINPYVGVCKYVFMFVCTSVSVYHAVCLIVCVCEYVRALTWPIYRVYRGECARFRDNFPYVKVHRYNPKHLYPKLNGYGDNGERKVWSFCGSTYCNYVA